MAEIAVSFLLHKLTFLLGDEVQLLSGVRAEVQYINEEFVRIKVFLRVADGMEDNDPELKVWVKQVREVSYDIEDVLDDLRHRFTHHNRSRGLYASLRKLSSWAKNPMALHLIASEMQAIKSRVASISEGHRKYCYRNNRVEQGSSSLTWLDCQGDALLLEDTDLVGIAEHKMKLIGWLVTGQTGRQVVSLVGMGGLGKTTLAKQVYEDAEVKKCFKLCAWVIVSRAFNIEELLKDMVQQLHYSVIGKPAPQAVDGMKTHQLQDMIKTLLKESRYLIVLDDVWQIEAWDAVKLALPNNNRSSRIMLTTRNKEVASTCCIGSHDMVYELEHLPEKESWTLFCKKTFRGNLCPAHLVEICECIVGICRGLPLAIVALGGVLAKKDHGNTDEWRNICRSIGAEIEGNHELGNMTKSADQNFATIAKEENVEWPDKVRRLSLSNTLQNLQQNKTTSHLRSLLMFGVMDLPTNISLSKLFPAGFRRLNVFDLQGAPLESFPGKVAKLFHLKYLSFRDTKVKTIPRSIKKLINLETLDLKGTYVNELPVEILELKKLRHLLVYRQEITSYADFHSKHGFKAPAGIGGFQSLQKLCFVEADQGSSSTLMAELGKITKLRRLGIIKLRREDGVALCSSLEKLSNLRALSITSLEEDEIIDLQHISSPPPFLQRLYLTGVLLEKLPDWIASLRDLVRVYLKWSQLKTDPLIHLQGLPNLAHLELLQVYKGKELCFKAEGFQNLKVLGLDKFDSLEAITVEEGAMPKLEKLIIQRCELLKKVPSGIENLTELKVVEFFDMPDELITTLLPNRGDDHRKVAGVPAVYSSYLRDGGWDVYSLETFEAKLTSPGPSAPIRSTELRSALWKV
ncbi:hypothetical protein FH972_006197 [Carpinus fangiana]|uniref:AAA+ ATPase domain-containing protein n=1 Tax=Carpinus fangiana TaxID=176857 RepID=A0A5N6QRK5_9ROSI|nr:hypothetical protein FH972_006197 [Carpinus fangiana]